jgi:glutamate N-acetyltransferase / amino-acid N-acetyltransferase
MAAQKPSLSAFHRLLRRKILHSAAHRVRYYSAPLDGTVPAAKQKYIPTSESETNPKGFMVSEAYVDVKTTNKIHQIWHFLLLSHLVLLLQFLRRTSFRLLP